MRRSPKVQICSQDLPWQPTLAVFVQTGPPKTTTATNSDMHAVGQNEKSFGMNTHNASQKKEGRFAAKLFACWHPHWCNAEMQCWTAENPKKRKTREPPGLLFYVSIDCFDRITMTRSGRCSSRPEFSQERLA